MSRLLAVVALGAVLGLACGGSTSTSPSATTFKGTKKVGYSGALTGTAAIYGHAISQGLKLAADDINAKGGVNGYKIEMDILDDGTTVPTATDNTKQLILQDNVVALMGSVTSAQCQAETPISKQNKVIFIAATSQQLPADDRARPDQPVLRFDRAQHLHGRDGRGQRRRQSGRQEHLHRFPEVHLRHLGDQRLRRQA